MEKWSCYLDFLQCGKGNFIFRTIVGLVLLPWFLFCAVVKAFLCLCVALGSLLIGVARLWMELVGGMVLIVTVMQMTGNSMGIPFWRLDSPWLFIGQILAICFILFAPELLTIFASASGMAFAELIEKFNIWILYKLS